MRHHSKFIISAIYPSSFVFHFVECMQTFDLLRFFARRSSYFQHDSKNSPILTIYNPKWKCKCQIQMPHAKCKNVECKMPNENEKCQNAKMSKCQRKMPNPMPMQMPYVSYSFISFWIAMNTITIISKILNRNLIRFHAISTISENVRRSMVISSWTKFLTRSI